MKLASYSNNEFVDQTSLNNSETLTRDSLLDITGNLHTPGLINASALSFSYSNLTITVAAPLPFRALFSDGTLASANGTTDGETTDSATVDFSSLVPSTGSITAYLVATSGSVMQEPYQIVGPPVGHPDFSSSFSPYTAYSEAQDTLQFQATTTAPDNLNTLFIASTVLSAGQTVITTSSTVGQVRAGAILSRNGEVLAADLGSGAAASNVGTLGGSLVGTLPNPTLAATGATSGTYINPVTITVDEDGRVSNIANVSNWNVPGNVTAGGTIVASGTATAAAATSSANLIPYGQAFQFLQPTASESITLGNVLHTVAQPSSGITADITITLEPGSVNGQDFVGYGSASASGSVTYQSNVTTGSPYIELPDGSQVYSWVIPASSPTQGIHADWDGTNWRARTFGQEVVAPATQSNAAVQLGQVLSGINIISEGADPTGVNDSTTAIQNAVNKGGLVYIPEGNFSVSGTLTSSSDVSIVGGGKTSKITFTGTGGLSFDQPSGQNNVSVKNLFITSSSNSAIAITQSVSGHTVYFNFSDLYINAPTTSTNFAINASGMWYSSIDKVAIVGSSGILLGANTVNNTISNSTLWGGGSVGNVGVQISGGAAPGVQGILFDNLVVLYFNNDVLIEGYTDFLSFSNCIFDQAGAAAILMQNDANGNTPSDCRFVSCYYGTNSTNGTAIEITDGTVSLFAGGQIAVGGSATGPLVALGSGASAITFRDFISGGNGSITDFFSFATTADGQGGFSATNCRLPGGGTYNFGLQTAPQDNYVGTSSPAASTEYTSSVSFTTPTNGWVYAVMAVHGTGVLNGGSVNLTVNGTSLASDNISSSATDYSKAAVSATISAGTAVTVETAYTTGSTAPSNPTEVGVSYVFVPEH